MSDISRAAEYIDQLAKAEANHAKHDCLAAKTVKEVRWQKHACEDFIMGAAPESLEDFASLAAVLAKRLRNSKDVDGLLPVATKLAAHLNRLSGFKSPLPKIYGVMRSSCDG